MNKKYNMLHCYKKYLSQNHIETIILFGFDLMSILVTLAILPITSSLPTGIPNLHHARYWSDGLGENRPNWEHTSHVIAGATLDTITV